MSVVVENPASMISILKGGIKIFAVGFIIISLIASLYKSFEEKNIGVFFTELGVRVFASDKHIYDIIQELKTSESTFNNIILYIDMFSSVEVLFIIIGATKKIFSIMVGYASPLFLWLLAFLVVGLIEMTFLAITTPELGLSKESWAVITPYRGLFTLFKNLLFVITPLKNIFENINEKLGFLDKIPFLN